MNVVVSGCPWSLYVDLLEQCRAEPLGDPAMDLPFDDRRVDDRPAVMDDGVSLHVDQTRVRVHGDATDVRGVAERSTRRVVGRRRTQPW